jgi:raffinose/stachyose/melibiose transport system substrate-binding protein
MNESKITRRKFIATTAAGIAATSLATRGIAASSKAIELRFFFRAAWPSSEPYNNWIIEQWNAKNGDRIHVTGSSADGETYKTKQTIELSSSNPPDVFYSWEGGRAGELIDNGFAAPLDDYYTKYGWDKRILPAGQALATFDGKKYFLATEMCSSVVWYRKDLYSHLGLSIPKTWDELMANAEKAKASSLTPFMLSNQKKWPSQFMWSAIFVNKHGLDAYNDLMGNKIPWTDPRAIEVTAIMKKLADDKMFEDSFNSLDLGPAMVLFSQGKVLHWYQGSFNLGRFRGDQPECCVVPIDFFPMPQIGDRKPVMSVFAEDTHMIHAVCKNKDAAAEFLNWYVSPEVTKKKLEIDKPFPSTIDADTSKLSEMEQRLAKAMADSGSFTFMHVDHAVAPAISDRFLTEVQGVLSDATSPEEAMKVTEDEAVRTRGAVKS